MGIKFGDTRKYLKGTASIFLTDISGNYIYSSDKVVANVTTNVNLDEIRGGLMNPIAAVIPSNAGLSIDCTAQNFDFNAKTKFQLGAATVYGAPEMVCEDVTASGTTLTFTGSKGTPIAAAGATAINCYVQEIGSVSRISVDGTAYTVTGSGSNYTVSGFNATSGKTYKVWYYINRPDAEKATITTLMKPQIVGAHITYAVYENAVSSNAQESTIAGFLHVHIPLLNLNGNGNITGEQTSNDTTTVSGFALPNDSDVVATGCTGCGASGSVLAYYIYIPCVTSAESFRGIVGNVGPLSVGASSTAQLAPYAIMQNGQLSKLAPTDCTYVATGAPSGTTVGARTGIVAAGSTTGDFTVKVTYTVGSTAFTDVVDVSVS